jgi:transcriptional regulator with XRE-family HTH domain
MVQLLSAKEEVTPLKLRVGRRIAALRKRARLSQAELAEACHVSSSYFGHVERGARLPARGVLKDAAKALDSDPDELLELAEYIEPRQGEHPIYAPPEKDAIIRRILRHPVERLQDIEAWLRIRSTYAEPPEEQTEPEPEDKA